MPYTDSYIWERVRQCTNNWILAISLPWTKISVSESFNQISISIGSIRYSYQSSDYQQNHRGCTRGGSWVRSTNPVRLDQASKTNDNTLPDKQVWVPLFITLMSWWCNTGHPLSHWWTFITVIGSNLCFLSVYWPRLVWWSMLFVTAQTFCLTISQALIERKGKTFYDYIIILTFIFSFQEMASSQQYPQPWDEYVLLSTELWSDIL